MNKNKSRSSQQRQPKPSCPPKESALANRLVEAARYNANCICNRPPTKVVCTRCSSVSFGRARRPCPVHPNVLFLMDFQLCPKCWNNNRFLKEMPAEDPFGGCGLRGFKYNY